MTPISFDPILHSTRHLLWLVPAFLTLGSLKLLFAAKLKGAAGEAAVAAILNRTASNVLHDIIIPNGRGGLTQLDHVALLPAGLLVVETKNYSGRIFGRARDRKWTQRLGGRSFKMNNPLHQNYGHIQALKALLPGTPIHGLVAFAGSARFPKGMPEGVATTAGLRAAIKPFSAEPGDSANIQEAWTRLESLARTGPEARNAHLDQLQARHGRDLRAPVTYAMLVVVGAVSLGLLMT